MKRALFCVWMVLALGWCAAWAETDWPPMTAEIMEFYENRQMELCAWLFEDKVLFCFPSEIAKGVCEEAPNRDAATFDPEVMRTMEARIVPYIEPEEIGGPSEEVGL